MKNVKVKDYIECIKQRGALIEVLCELVKLQDTIINRQKEDISQMKNLLEKAQKCLQFKKEERPGNEKVYDIE